MQAVDGCGWKRVFASFFAMGSEEIMEKRRVKARFLEHLRMGARWLGWQRKDYPG